MRPLIAAALALGMAACASAPKKPASEAAALPDRDAGQREAIAYGSKKSPYAPAQEDPSKRGHYTAGGLYAPHIADSAPTDIPDVDAIPEPEITDEPRSRYGNRSIYSVLGKKYRVLDDAKGYLETGTASYYGTKFHGRRTSNMEVYDMYAFSAAHKTLPLPSFARVTNLDNGKSVTVRVNDRGPFHAGRIIDLSYAAAVKLGITKRGTGRVEVRALTADESKSILARANREPAPAPPATSTLDKLVAAIPVASAKAAETRSAAGSDYRFDMRQDGKPMSADEFEAWMKARQVRIATGKPRSAKRLTDKAANPAPSVEAEGAPEVSREDDRVILQIASFAARANAYRALSMRPVCTMPAPTAKRCGACASGHWPRR